MDNSTQALFDGLQALSESAFPKRCATCGKVYADANEFFCESTALGGGKSGLKSSFDDNDLPVVELFRNCVCGSTLLDFFSDRRDTTERGLKRRAVFESVLKLLESRNVSREAGRLELLKVMRGGSSELLESLGLKLQKGPVPKS